MRRIGPVFGVLCCLAPSVFAIIPNLGLDATFPFVGRNEFGSGSVVAVGPRAIITARHLGVINSNITFTANASGPFYAVDLASQTLIDNTDLQMYRTLVDLPAWAPIDFTPLPSNFTHSDGPGGGINISQNASGSFASLMGVGFGLTGTLNGTSTGYLVDGTSAQHRRAAPFFSDSRGTITLAGTGPFASVLSFLINNGDGSVEGGDSGGGLFRNVGGQWRLVGINSFNGGSDRIFATGFDANRRNGLSSLQWLSGFAELAPHQTEINNFLVPEPASFAIVGLGIAALLRRRKK